MIVGIWEQVVEDVIARKVIKPDYGRYVASLGNQITFR